MKKNIARVALTIALLLALLNLVAFLLPFSRTASFWVGYTFTSLAILAQLPLTLYAFTAKGGARNSLYGFPIARLALAIIGCMATSAIRDEIRRQDARLQKDVFVMRELRSRASALAGQAQGMAVQEQLKKLADEFRFSDPVSSDATSPLESDLRACMDNLERALADGDMESISKLCPKATALLEERNRICKLNK